MNKNLAIFPTGGSQTQILGLLNGIDGDLAGLTGLDDGKFYVAKSHLTHLVADLDFEVRYDDVSAKFQAVGLDRTKENVVAYRGPLRKKFEEAELDTFAAQDGNVRFP